MGGITSAASKTAQSGPTQIVTSDAGGNLATSSLAGLGLASTADVGAINSQLTAINAHLSDLDMRSSRAYTGVAMAFAMAGVPTLLPNEKFAATMNYGTFQGGNGVAINGAFRLNSNMQLAGGIAYGLDSNIAGGRVGLRVGW
jgi:trimeric autotransporter adhesin